MKQTGVVLAIAVVAAAGGCGEAGHESSPGLRDGVYEYELSREYLRRNGIPAEQARTESGVHRITIDRGSFIERWRTADGTVGACTGVYSLDGNRAAFRWTGGCTGDWAMSYATDDDRLSWSDIEPLDADAGPAEQRVTEVFNSVPWTRTGEEPKEGEQ